MTVRTRLPLSVRMPLLAGLAVLVACTVTSAMGFHFMNRELRFQAQNLADTYLDSLSGAAAQAVRSGDFALLQHALETALGFQVGVVDRIVAVGRPDGTVLARAGAADAEPPMRRGVLSGAWEPGADGETAWAQREVEADGGVIALAAVQLAFPHLVERRQALVARMALATFAVTGFSAALAMLMTRRAMGSVLSVARRLEAMAAGHVPATHAWSEDERLTAALDMLLARLREREELAARLAERERIAGLGRLAATVAHEVRNPLAGMLTCVDTLRHFGADGAVRDRSLDLLERGLQQIGAVVRTTLAAHRADGAARAITAEDLDDLRLLVEPEASRRGVRLEWQSALSGGFPAEAVPLRQILLNLLLNAIAATPAGGTVTLRAGIAEDHLMVEVLDEGGGMSAAVRDRLSGRAAPPAGDALGLEVAARLATLVRGRIAAGHHARGSRVALAVPAAPDLQAPGG